MFLQKFCCLGHNDNRSRRLPGLMDKIDLASKNLAALVFLLLAKLSSLCGSKIQNCQMPSVKWLNNIFCDTGPGIELMYNSVYVAKLNRREDVTKYSVIFCLLWSAHDVALSKSFNLAQHETHIRWLCGDLCIAYCYLVY